MQFIQLQPQIAAQVPIPAAGNVNFFVDVNNNAVSLIDDNGQPVSVGGGSTPVTYSELVDKITGETLTQGAFYLITDFRTCYDQPDFDSNRNAIVGNNYKEASIDPIIVFALSSNTLSNIAYQPSYPKDKIQYDWTFSVTEKTGGPAYGRITERIDEFNNRTDYDHRTIQFKRYQYIELNMSNIQNGTVDVSVTTEPEMLVTGTNTLFSGLSIGQYIGFGSQDNFKPYEITSIVSDTEMYITGLTTTNLSGVKFYPTNTSANVSYYQNNLTTAYTEYYTFDYAYDVINNHIGNFSNLYDWNGSDFLLANNVFIGGAYINNTFGDACYNNTFDDDCSNNIVGNWFYNNITDDDFDGNVIGNWFNNNRITSNFQYNRIGENFEDNYLVQNSFYRNNIMNYFQGNIIDGSDFQNNEIGNQFGNNKILFGQFYKNDIGNGYNNNNIYSNVYGNIIGNGFNYNNIYSSFHENTIGEVFENNNLGNPLSFGSFDFNDNKIGNAFQNNTCLGTFAYNSIGSNFYNNTVKDNFGFGYSSSQGNTIGNYFYNNTIGEYFYNNVIADGFFNNQAGDYFQMNNVKAPFVNGIDFNFYYGNITAFTYTATGFGASDNIYTGVEGTTNANGIDASFDIEVSSGSVIGVTGNTQGKFYAINNTITILGSQIGGTDGFDDVVITVTGVSQTPSVFEPYNCDIFKNSGNIDRLSFYDASDILTITNINE